MTTSSFRSLLLVSALIPIAGCGAPSSSNPHGPTPQPEANINLIFVVSEDAAFNESEDFDPVTANLTNKGLQRTLLLAPYLQQTVLGNNNVNGIYALQPMSHLQTDNDIPDMVAIETIQQFAMMNQYSLPQSPLSATLYTANSFPINASYSIGQTIDGVATPYMTCEGCQGLDFKDQNSDNEELIGTILSYGTPGYFIFSAPWETVQDVLTKVNAAKHYSLPLPTSYQGPNFLYALSVTPSGSATLTTYNSNLNPPSTYPALPDHVINSAACRLPLFNITANASAPPVSNTNETMYLIRHAEAHPTSGWEDGNYVAAGQWRALDLPKALKGKIDPDEVYSIDPAQAGASGNLVLSYVRPSLTVAPYAIANRLPYHLAADFELNDLTNVTQNTIEFFFSSPQFSNHKILLAWEHDHYPPLINALLKSYGSDQTVPSWQQDDYDSIWTVRLDSSGNLSVDNSLCEGIDSTTLPKTAPQF